MFTTNLIKLRNDHDSVFHLIILLWIIYFIDSKIKKIKLIEFKRDKKKKYIYI